MTRRDQDALADAKALAKQLSETHEWIDVDDLEDDERFTQLVALLADRRLSDQSFALATRDGSKFLRAATHVAIANGRQPPWEWAERAKRRFGRAEWGERQLLLRALGA